MTEHHLRPCPDCGTELQAIQIVDKLSPVDFFRADSMLEYTAPGAKASWTGALPVQGRVLSMLCPACGRILLYGQPKNPPEKSRTEKKPGTSDEGASGEGASDEGLKPAD